MAAGRTYTPIATQTLSTSAASVTFSSIPSTYTDLVYIGNFPSVTGLNTTVQFNGDTAGNYSSTQLYGTGSGVGSYRISNSSSGYSGVADGIGMIKGSIQNYNNTSTYKTLIGRGGANVTYLDACVTLWRSTAAINSITFIASTSFPIGSTFTLYGIAAA